MITASCASSQEIQFGEIRENRNASEGAIARGILTRNYNITAGELRARQEWEGDVKGEVNRRGNDPES